MTQVGSWWKVSRWLIVGIILVLAGVYAGLKYLASSKAAPVTTTTAQVWVLTAPVAADSPIPPSSVKIESWPVNLLPIDAYNGSLTGVYTTEALPEGVPLVASELFIPSTSDLIPNRLPKGDVAFDFPTSPNTAVDGVIAPGDEIALLALVPPPGSTAASSSSTAQDQVTVFMQHLNVLAVNGALNGTATPGSGEQLILAVTPEQAEALVYAEAHTTFTVVLERPHQNLGKVPAYGKQWPAS
jgi:Flp pilus assembly protein CpaB